VFEASSRGSTLAPAPRPAQIHAAEAAAAQGGPFVLVPGGSPATASPRRPGHAPRRAGAWGPFEDARTACAHVGGIILAEAQAAILRRISRPARRRIDVLRRLAGNLEADLARAANHEGERREAETLAAYQSRIPNGAALVELPDLYDSERTMRIELDPSTPVHVQIEKRFRRAAKLEKSVEHTTRRLELARREAAELESALGLLERTSGFADALRLYEVMRAKFGIALDGVGPAGGATKKGAAAEKSRRSFDLDARWFAIVGRSNQENDEITFHVAGPDDWWFHAQGVPGSHVVLKARGGNDGPPARVVEMAASLAAHFSKARHSGLVPVIYTRRRHVRKFRGAAPGQVTCERETMVMVPPKLPGAGDE
jgi:predicted ribosome quality control (RQC) complex YloA/Tae2 family protein